MKKLVAWDTSSKTGVICAFEWDEEIQAQPRLVSEWSLDLDAGHSERLLWGVNQLLEGCRWKLEEIDVFGVGLGPGSFTGLRIGITTARTLSQILNKPLVGVSSLAVLARPVSEWATERFSDSQDSCMVIATTDACKGELFALWGLGQSITDCVVKAEGDLSGVWKRGVEEQAIRPEDLMSLLNKKITQSKKKLFYVRVGEGVDRYHEIWEQLPKENKISYPNEFKHQLQGRYLGRLVWEGFQAGIAREALKVNPRYLRASNAELKRLAGELNVNVNPKRMKD